MFLHFYIRAMLLIVWRTQLNGSKRKCTEQVFDNASSLIKISETPIQHEWNIYIHVVIGTLEVFWFNFQQTGSTFSMNAWKSKLCKIGSG